MTLPPCPVCGDEIDDSPELLPFIGDDDTLDVECVGCAAPLRIRRCVTCDYTVVHTPKNCDHVA